MKQIITVTFFQRFYPSFGRVFLRGNKCAPSSNSRHLHERNLNAKMGNLFSGLKIIQQILRCENNPKNNGREKNPSLEDMKDKRLWKNVSYLTCPAFSAAMNVADARVFPCINARRIQEKIGILNQNMLNRSAVNLCSNENC